MHNRSIIAVFLSISAAAFSLSSAAAEEASNATSAGTELRQDIAKGAENVREYAGDAFISAKVKAALIADPDVKALDINVETMDKVVYLAGAAQTEEQKARAEQIARGIEDVKSVVNHIKTPGE